MKLSIIVANWNGTSLLRKCLPSVINSAKHTKEKYEIIVVDDASTDDSVKVLKSEFPDVKVIALKKNLGFIKVNNLGAKKAKGEILAFISNDIMPKRASFSHMLKHFKKKNTFAVAPKILKWDKKTIQTEFLGCKFVLGTIVQTHPNIDEIDTNEFKEPCLTFFAPSCTSMFERKRFLKLGGFDEIYSPFYSEEPDIAYRAYKRGWSVIYEPKAVVFHKHQASLSKAFKREALHIQELKARFIFTWSNFFDPKILFKHFAFLPLIFLRSAFVSPYRGKRFLDIIAFFQALKYWKWIIKKRSKEKREAKLSDKEALEIINGNGANDLTSITFRKFLGF